MQKRTVIGLLGLVLDRGEDATRWQQWRPTVSLFQHDEMLIHRLELLAEPGDAALAKLVAADIQTVSPETTVRTHEMSFDDPWDFEEVFGKMHAFARGYAFDTENEEYLFHITTGTHVAQICMFLLTESRHFPGRIVQTAPPRRGFSTKPARYSIIDLDLSKYDRIAQRFAHEKQEAAEFLKGGIQTRNAAFNRLIDEIEHIAIHSKAPILLTGPTGSGKSSLARRIFELKRLRRQVTGRFVESNCATVRGDGAMSALFGHKRGAFTGATHDRQGLLREADKGMLFLDEVAQLGLDEQAMLLRAIEEKRFLPLGADREVESDFQLVCGTNRDLAAALESGEFREDLLARINMWCFELPGLAERREDIRPNIEYELAQLTAATGTMVRFNKEAIDRFGAFAMAPDSAWTGNFRDLNSSIARMATMSRAGRITTEIVDAELERLRRAWRRGSRTAGESVDALAELMGERLAKIDEFDRVQLAHVLRICRESPTLSAAGRRLFAASRQRRAKANDADRLRKYLASFGLSWVAVR